MNRKQRRAMKPNLRQIARQNKLPFGFVRGLAEITHGNKPIASFGEELLKLAKTHEVKDLPNEGS